MKTANEHLEFEQLVDKLAESLNIARHPDTATTIKAARMLIESLIRDSQDNEAKSNKGAKFTIDQIELPKTSRHKVDSTTLAERSLAAAVATEESKDEPDEVVDRARRALKLLYLDDLKQLQLQVNDIIASIQTVTENPKTDWRLSAKGR